MRRRDDSATGVGRLWKIADFISGTHSTVLSADRLIVVLHPFHPQLPWDQLQDHQDHSAGQGELAESPPDEKDAEEIAESYIC